MASVHRMRRSPYWYGAFTMPDGRRAFRSTGCRNKKQALKIVLEWDAAAREGREGRLTELRTRETMSAIFKSATGRSLPCATMTAFLDA